MIWLLGLIGLIANAIAWRNGFYSIDPFPPWGFRRTTLKHVISIFAIYLSTSFFVPALIATLAPIQFLQKLAGLTWIQSFTIAATILLLVLYCSTLSPADMKAVWKGHFAKETPSLLSDFVFGALCWFLIFPVITFLGHFLDILVKALFGLEYYEQVAVRFLKMAQAYPPLLIVVIISIVIIAPLVEEFLFRGILQTWLKKHLGPKAAIGLASLAFALFHFSPSQKMGNIPLVTSLFAFAAFLGFLYEKRRSLLAPIGLHLAFNLMSSLRVILLLKGD